MDASDLKNISSLFPKGERASGNYFTGVVWINIIMPNDKAINCQIANVEFEPGARTFWHTHSGGQVLIVTEGSGHYFEKGKPIRSIRKGDVINIQPNVEHWHGATASTGLTHIAINPNTQQGAVSWLRPVSDDEYNIYG